MSTSFSVDPVPVPVPVGDAFPPFEVDAALNLEVLCHGSYTESGVNADSEIGEEMDMDSRIGATTKRKLCRQDYPRLYCHD